MAMIDIDPRELYLNNLKTLKTKKSAFKLSSINSFQVIGFAFICVLYLQNISFVRFLLRICLHFLLIEPFPRGVSVSENQRKRIIKSLFITMLVLNAMCFCLDSIVGVPSNELDIGLGGSSSSCFFGGISIQIIGEHKPSTRLSLLYLNIIIFSIQYCLIYHSTILDVNKSITESEETITQLEMDGFSGRTKLSEINLISVSKEIMGFTYVDEHLTQNDTDASDTYDGY